MNGTQSYGIISLVFIFIDPLRRLLRTAPEEISPESSSLKDVVFLGVYEVQGYSTKEIELDV